MKSTWRTVEFVRSAYHARGDATQLWSRTNDLYLLIEKIDSVVREHADPLQEDVVLIVQKALKASNRTLDELARRCLNLGDRDDLTLWSKMARPICFTLSADSIQKFEQQLQTNIMSVQIAFFLLGRGEQQELTRRVNDLLSTLEIAVAYIARHTPRTRQFSHALDQPARSFAALETLDECVEAATSTMTARTVLTASPQMLGAEEDGMLGSQLYRLASQESQAWGEIAGRPSRSTTSTERTRASVGSTALIDAIKYHSREEFQRLLDDGINLNGTDDEGYTPLMHTIIHHDTSCNECLRSMHALLQLSIDVDASNNGDTALHMSVKHDNLGAARALLNKGASIDVSLPNTPMMLAAQSRKVAFVELFLTSTPSPDVNTIDRDGWSIVHYAVWKNSKDMLLTLLKNNEALHLNMNIDARCSMDWTPLMRLAENADHPKSVQLATILLDYGADVNAVDLCGSSALHYAISSGTYSPQRNDFIRLLVERGADVDAVRSKASKGVVDRFPALRRSTSNRRRDSVLSNSDMSPPSRRGSSFRRRWSRT